MATSTYYTYLHRTLDTNTIFYIGKGIKYRHKISSNRNAYWNAIVSKHGFESEIIATWDSEEEAYQHEEFLISCFKDMNIKLANLAIGGKGGLCGTIQSEETKNKKSLKMKQILKDPLRKQTNEINLIKLLNNKEIQDKRINAVKASFLVESHKRNAHLKRMHSDKFLQAKRCLKMKQAWDNLEKREKRLESFKKGADSKNAKSIFCVEANQIFLCIIDAAKWLRDNGFHKASGNSITRSLRGHRKTYCGYHWEYTR